MIMAYINAGKLILWLIFCKISKGVRYLYILLVCHFLHLIYCCNSVRNMASGGIPRSTQALRNKRLIEELGDCDELIDFDDVDDDLSDVTRIANSADLLNLTNETNHQTVYSVVPTNKRPRFDNDDNPFMHGEPNTISNSLPDLSDSEYGVNDCESNYDDDNLAGFDKAKYLKMKLAKIYVEDRVSHKTIAKINGAPREVGLNLPKSAAGHLRPLRKVQLEDGNL